MTTTIVLDYFITTIVFVIAVLTMVFVAFLRADVPGQYSLHDLDDVAVVYSVTAMATWEVCFEDPVSKLTPSTTQAPLVVRVLTHSQCFL